MTDKDAYVQKLHAKLDEWNAEIDKLKAKADKAEADSRVEYQVFKAPGIPWKRL